MKFAYISQYEGCLSQEHLCDFFGVTSRGLRAWKVRGASKRQCKDMILLAHIKEHHRLCLGTYGRSRMTQELKEEGLQVGERCVGRLMAANDIRVDRKRKYRVTTDSAHSLGVAPNLLGGDFACSGPNQNGPQIYPTSGHKRAGSTWPS